MRWVSLAVIFCVIATPVASQEYPTRAVRIVVPSPPGGGTDIVARVLAADFSKSFAQPFVVENKPGAVSPLLGRIEAERLCEAFAGYGGYRNLVYFACCNVLRGEKGRAFARRFLKVSGARAVIGYSRTVDWMASLVADMLFLHRFYKDPSPWKNLRRIFNSVSRDYPAARRLGHTLIT